MESKTTRPDGLEHVLPWFLVMLIQCEGSATIHLDKGQNIDQIDLYDGKTALNMAAAGGHLGLVRLLLSRGADTTIADFTGRTPLMWAAEKNQLAIVNILLAHRGQHGAWHKAAALWLATRTGYPEIVRVLLADGANQEKVVYKNQGTARQLAAARGEGDECLAVMQVRCQLHP
jgi:ankyrin repeat protein